MRSTYGGNIVAPYWGANCPPGQASGTTKVKRSAVYGMRQTFATIAPADQHTKPVYQIRQAVWNYKPGRVTLIKAK
jgi:hypothetical protein